MASSWTTATAEPIISTKNKEEVDISIVDGDNRADVTEHVTKF